tara:strand:- start:1566 stop:2414 length:849 start_codon:yes stop_codon:yes gene_type:complete
MDKDVIEYEIDNIDSNKLIKKDYLINNGFTYRFIYEYSLNDLNTLITENYLFNNNNLYVCKLYFNSKKELSYNYKSYDELSFYINSNNTLYDNYEIFLNMYDNLPITTINDKGYLYIEQINMNQLHNIDEIYFYQLFVYIENNNNEINIYLYNHNYYLNFKFDSETYNVNYISGYYSFFTKSNIEYMNEQASNIIISIMDIYSNNIINNNDNIDIWKFIFSIDKNYNLTLYDYNRFDNNINIFVSINENYDESTYNDILTNVNNISSIDNDINFVFLKKYNL